MSNIAEDDLRKLEEYFRRRGEENERKSPIQTGWLCPACGRGNTPINMTCPCKGWPKMEITC